MIKGTYIFYQDGKEIFRSKNVITKFGARYLTNLIAGNIPVFKLDMVFGIDSTAASNSDTRLGFEFYRTPILFGSTDIQTTSGVTTYSVVYKTTLQQDIIGKINEIGIYPSTRLSVNNYDSKYISDFNNPLSWIDSNAINPSLDTTNYRIGGNLLNFTAVSGNSNEYKSSIVPLDLSGYSVNDDISLAFYKNDSNLSSLKVRFYSDSTKYFEKTLTSTQYGAGSGYKIPASFTLGDLYSSPTNSATAPDKTSINEIGIIVTASGGNTTVGMDGLRINDQDTFDPTFGLISRSIVSPMLDKVGGRPVDVEYRLDLDF
jgi:hypothetical protein